MMTDDGDSQTYSIGCIDELVEALHSEGAVNTSSSLQQAKWWPDDVAVLQTYSVGHKGWQRYSTEGSINTSSYLQQPKWWPDDDDDVSQTYSMGHTDRLVEVLHSEGTVNTSSYLQLRKWLQDDDDVSQMYSVGHAEELVEVLRSEGAVNTSSNLQQPNW